jgi:hypothetical protein
MKAKIARVVKRVKDFEGLAAWYLEASSSRPGPTPAGWKLTRDEVSSWPSMEGDSQITAGATRKQKKSNRRGVHRHHGQASRQKPGTYPHRDSRD